MLPSLSTKHHVQTAHDGTAKMESFSRNSTMNSLKAVFPLNNTEWY